MSLQKVFIYQVPMFHLGITFRELKLIDEHGLVMLVAKHMVSLLSFTTIEKGKIGQPAE